MTTNAKMINLNDIKVANDKKFTGTMKRMYSRIMNGGYVDVCTEFDTEKVAKYLDDIVKNNLEITNNFGENLSNQLFFMNFFKEFTSLKDSFEEASEGLDKVDALHAHIGVFTKMSNLGLAQEIIDFMDDEGVTGKFAEITSNHAQAVSKLIRKKAKEITKKFKTQAAYVKSKMAGCVLIGDERELYETFLKNEYSSMKKMLEEDQDVQE